MSSTLVNIGLGSGLLPVKCQVITLANADMLWIGPSETNFSDILTELQ